MCVCTRYIGTLDSHTHRHTDTYMHVHKHTHASSYLHTIARARTYTHRHTDTHMHVHTHTQLHTQSAHQRPGDERQHKLFSLVSEPTIFLLPGNHWLPSQHTAAGSAHEHFNSQSFPNPCR